MRLEQTLFGVTFQNPVLLAAGTCGFGRELADVLDLESLGGFVTKSVTLEPRSGNPAPRVSELAVGMINSIGLANPGAEHVKAEYLPWIRDHVSRPQVFVSVAGHSADEYATVVEMLAGEEGFLGFELNLSCPNDTGLGLPFALDPDAMRAVIERCRPLTDRPVLAKLAPNAPDLTAIARVAEGAGADGVTMINTLPARAVDPRTREPSVGAGSGGLSGPALRPMGVHWTHRSFPDLGIPILGVGGITAVDDAVQYLMAGASLVQIGTATFAAPRAAERIVRGLSRWRGLDGAERVTDLVGAAHTKQESV